TPRATSSPELGCSRSPVRVPPVPQPATRVKRAGEMAQAASSGATVGQAQAGIPKPRAVHRRLGEPPPRGARRVPERLREEARVPPEGRAKARAEHRKASSSMSSSKVSTLIGTSKKRVEQRSPQLSAPRISNSKAQPSRQALRAIKSHSPPVDRV